MRRLIILATAAVGLVLASCQPATEKQEPEFAQPGTVAQVAVGDLQWCEIIARRATVEDCETAQKTQENVETGTALIEWPKSIKRGERATIRLQVGNTQPPAAEAPAAGSSPSGEITAEEAEALGSAEDAASSSAGRPRETSDDPVPATRPEVIETTPYSPFVGRLMSAQLTGAGFEITPSASVSKELPPNSQIDWEWVVVAKHDGLQTLVVTTYVEFEDASGKRIPLGVTQKEQKFDVKVGVLGWIEDFLTDLPDWLKKLTAVLIALTGTVGAFFGLRRVLKNRGEGKT